MLAVVFRSRLSPQSLEALPKRTAHLQAQREGRDEFYSEYRLQVCALVRTSEFGPAEQ